MSKILWGTGWGWICRAQGRHPAGRGSPPLSPGREPTARFADCPQAVLPWPGKGEWLPPGLETCQTQFQPDEAGLLPGVAFHAGHSLGETCPHPSPGGQAPLSPHSPWVRPTSSPLGLGGSVQKVQAMSHGAQGPAACAYPVAKQPPRPPPHLPWAGRPLGKGRGYVLFKRHNRGVRWLSPGRPHPKVKYPTCSRWARGNWPGSHCFFVLLKMVADTHHHHHTPTPHLPEPWSRGRGTPHSPGGKEPQLLRV